MSGFCSKDKGNVFYVYALLDPRKPGPFKYSYWKFDYEPFYIGKGHNGRAHSHFKSITADTIVYKNTSIRIKLIRKLKCLGYEEIPIKFLRVKLSEYEALDLEEALIDIIGRRDIGLGPLTNQTDGGRKEGGQASSRIPTITTEHCRGVGNLPLVEQCPTSVRGLGLRVGTEGLDRGSGPRVGTEGRDRGSGSGVGTEG
jgi:hypothetical protein